jgi:hypothetical protein
MPSNRTNPIDDHAIQAELAIGSPAISRLNAAGGAHTYYAIFFSQELLTTAISSMHRRRRDAAMWQLLGAMRVVGRRCHRRGQILEPPRFWFRWS